jgi:hypothetical protein
MSDSIGPLPPLTPLIATGAAPVAHTIELAQAPPTAVLLASTLSAVVVGRGGNGALLLSTDYGTLALKTALDLATGSRVDLKLLPGPPAAVALLNLTEPTTPGAAPAAIPLATAAAASATATATASSAATTTASAVVTTGAAVTASGTPSPAPAPAAPAPPPAQLDLGTEVAATLVALAPTTDPAAASLAVGTRVTLRIAPPDPEEPPPPPSGPQPVSFIGTVAAPGGDNQGRTALNTPLGTLQLDQRLALSAGTVLSLTPLTTTPPGASLASLDVAMVVQARVLSVAPGDPAGSLPPGTSLMLRVAATPDELPAPDLAGTIAAGGSNETVLETPIGMLTLDRRLALPAGTTLALQRLAAMPPDQPPEPPLAERASWPALEQSLAVLDRAAPELAARLRSDLTPRSGQQLAGTLLFLMNAVSNGTWPGPKAAAALDGAGRHDLHQQLVADASELRQLTDPQNGDWRVFVLPTLDGAMIRPVRLYLRRGTRGAAQADQGTRFVLDVDMSRLGALQFDGLVRRQRFDLVLRSNRPITADMRQEIAALFRDTTSAAGLAGDVTFTTASRFAVAPLDALRTHVGVNA